MESLSLRKKAINYRKRGCSYNIIQQKLGISKSTLSGWLKGIPYTPNKEVLKRIGAARIKSAIYKNKQQLQNIFEMKKFAKEEIGLISKRDLWFLGIGLYLGEGSKLYENIRIINSDPNIIRLAIRWFKNICNLKTENFSPFIHLYPDTNINKTLQFWSKITEIPKKNFGRTQIDKRTNKSLKKKRILPYGTLHIQIKSLGKKEFGRSLHRRIMGWIEATLSQI